MKERRRVVLRALGAAAATSLGATRFARAQMIDGWPSRPIRLIVDSAAGGGSDSISRAFARSLEQRVKQPVIVENKPGAAGAIAAEAARNAPPDGHMLLYVGVSMSSANPALYKKLRYDPGKDFEYVGMFGSFPYIALVRNDSPYRSIADIIVAAKADPGKITYGYSAAGSRMPSELLRVQAGIDIMPVPYKAAPQVMIGLAGGQVEFAIMDAISALSPIKGGLLRPIGVTSPERSPSVAGVPPFAQTLPGFAYEGWSGLGVPAGTPKQIIEALNRHMRESLKEPAMAAAVRALALAERPLTVQEMTEFTVADRRRWKEMMRVTGIERID